MDTYSGLVDLFEKKGLLTKQGNKLAYTGSDKNTISEFRKNWTGDKLDIIMKDFHNISTPEIKEPETDGESDDA